MISSKVKHFVCAAATLIVAAQAAWGQVETRTATRTGSWSLDECLKYAVAHSTSVQKKEWEVKGSKADLLTAEGGFIPTLNSQVSGQYNWGRNIDPETNTYKTQTTFDNYYQLYTSLTVFDGGATIGRFRQAKAKRENSLNELQKVQEDKEIEVMQKFVDLVYATECTHLAQDKLAESSRLLEKTRRQEELGMKGKPDVAQIAAQVAEDEYNFTHQTNMSLSARLALESAMNFPLGDSLEVDTLLRSIQPQYRLEIADNIFENAAVNNTAARIAAFSSKDARFNYRQQKSAMMPSVMLFAGVATNFYENLTNDGSTTGFSSQFKNNMGEYVGVTLTVPIFNLSSYGKIRRAYCDMRGAQIGEQETLRKLHDDIAQAVMDVNGYVKEVAQMENKVAADQLSYDQSSRKYEEGMLSTFDLRTAANTLLQSRISLLQMRMLYVMKDRLVDYYKGVGIIRVQ